MSAMLTIMAAAITQAGNMSGAAITITGANTAIDIITAANTTMEDVMSITQVTRVRRAQVTSRFAGLTIKSWGAKSVTSIRPRKESSSHTITAMNPGETVVYQQKACVVLDARHEGYPESEDHVLLEELTHYSANTGRVRHLAHLNDLDKDGSESLPGSPAE